MGDSPPTVRRRFGVRSALRKPTVTAPPVVMSCSVSPFPSVVVTAMARPWGSWKATVTPTATVLSGRYTLTRSGPVSGGGASIMPIGASMATPSDFLHTPPTQV